MLAKVQAQAMVFRGASMTFALARISETAFGVACTMIMSE
jgi:hypothetical protein